MALSLQTLPLETVYRILDHLSDEQLFLTASNICQRLDMIVNSYYRFRNSIGGEGARHLSQALQHNTTLTQLNLVRNWIGAEGARHLSQALQHNATLTQLNVVGNGIGNDGGESLRVLIRTRRDLKISLE